MSNVRIPQNQIISKYTSGKEYMLAKTQNEYKGYYYELNNKSFAGKTFDPNNPEIVKIKSDKFNKLLGKAATYIYGAVSGVKIPNIKVSPIPNDLSRGLNFYCKKINNNSIKIIDEETYLSLQKDPLYQTTYIGDYKGKYQSLEQAETQLPGITIFRENEVKDVRE